MRKKTTNAILASILAAAITVPMTVSTAVPLTVSAGEILGETDFEHKMLPWNAYEAVPAKQNFNLDEGTAHIQIIIPSGENREKTDLQFRHGGLSFHKDHKYKVSFKAKSSRDGLQLQSSITNSEISEEYFVLDGETQDMHMGPHMDGMWPTKPVLLTDKWQTFEGTFIPTKDLENVQWTFLYAKGTQYFGNAVEGDEIWFDEMSIECTTCNECTSTHPRNFGYVTRDYSGLKDNYISVNQVGYYPNLAKNATLSDNKGDLVYQAQSISLEDAPYPFEIVDNKTGKVAFTGETGAAKKDSDSGDTVCKINFTEFNTPGEYYIRIPGKEWRSFPFKIGTDIYQETGHDLLTNSLNFFYQQRSGAKIESDYITSGDTEKLAHQGGHLKDTAYVQKCWRNEYLAQIEATDTYASSTLDVTGGWYDAADYGKYMTDGCISVWTLQNMYERAAQTEEGKKKFADGSGTVTVPEKGNKIPDILDECKYELDFMSKMKVEKDEPTWGEFAGLYYHKVQDHKWVGIATRPWDYEKSWKTVRIVKPPTFAATLNYAACAAQGARLWAAYNADYAKALLKSAKEAYAAFLKYYYEAERDEENNDKSLYAPLYQAKSGEPYGDTAVLDDLYWASCELFITAKAMDDADAATYLKQLSDYNEAFMVKERISGGENEYFKGTFTMLNWGNTAGAGTLSLALHKDLLTDTQKKTMEESILKVADSFINTEKAQGYGIPYLYDSQNAEPMGLSYNPIHGYEYGSNGIVINNLIAMAYAYDQTGDSKYISGVTTGMDYLLGNNPLSFSYITGYGDYCEEAPYHRFWAKTLDSSLPSAPDGVLSGGPNAGLQDPYVRGLGFVPGAENTPSQRCFTDSAESWATNSVSLQWNAPLAWVVSFLQDEAPKAPATDKPEKIVWGDTDDNGSTDISDAVLLAKFLSEDAEAKVSAQGQNNANIIKGELNQNDLIAILMQIAKLVDSRSFPLEALPSVKK